MATVSAAAITRIHDVEGTLTTVNIGSGGGATANTDIFIQNSQSLGRRRSAATLEGFFLTDAADNDLSAADIHVGAWFWVTHYGQLTALRIRLAENTSTNYDEHIVPLTEITALGGWIRVWVDISRTPDATGGTALNEALVRNFGIVVSLPTVGGTTPNVILDAIDHTTTGLSLTGTSGLWSDFVTADEGTLNNKYGCIGTVSGINYVRARLTLGTASSLVFNDSNFTIVFPQQNLVNDTFMGITCDLQHASTNIDWASGSISSPGAKKGDLIVTGTSGDWDATGMSLSGLRVITLTSVCSLINSSITGCGQVTAPGAVLTGNKFTGYEGAANSSYLIWDVATDPNGKFDNSTFTKGTAATHAIEFGTTSPTSMTLTNVTFTGYNGSNNQNDSAIHVKRTTGTVTITITGGTSPSYRTDGAAVVIVAGAVSVAVNVKDINTGSNIQNANVLIKAASGGPMSYLKSTAITRVSSTATAVATGHGMLTNDYVVIKGANQPEYNGIHQITRVDDDTFTYAVTGTPATPATGTITTTGAPLYGLTDSSGNLSTSRVYGSSQPIVGWARKATSGTKYKPASISGTISNTLGFSATVQLIPDE
jgi:hypothetical protein